ncbi:Abi family protein [Luteibacter yeojuensis]|uniref:Abi family protein n=1 Tax=Luteibacter yeojuensis TaxID=345309 RepID=UPI000AB8F456|nr:Abi family protein [Luteibacter yeojuensis]
MPYTKGWKSYADQVDQLEARGLEIGDRESAIRYMKRIGYYRISGYWFPLRKRTGPVVLLNDAGQRPQRIREVRIPLDEFLDGARLADAIELYVFDKKLRMLTLDALERIEIALRVDISHTLGAIDAFAYLRPACLHPDFSESIDQTRGVTRHHEWLGRHARLVGRSREDFVRHNKEKYGLPLAIWVACEVWDFGTLSTLFGGMRESEQDAISQLYGVKNGRIFATWLRSLNYLRNICAHHSRLWNRNIIDQPKLPPLGEVPGLDRFRHDAHARARCYLLLLLTKHLMDVINPGST